MEQEGSKSGKKLTCDKITKWPYIKVITNNWGKDNKHNLGEREFDMATNSQQESGKSYPGPAIMMNLWNRKY